MEQWWGVEELEVYVRNLFIVWLAPLPAMSLLCAFKCQQFSINNLLWSSGMPPGGFAALMAAIAGNTAAIAGNTAAIAGNTAAIAVEGARSSNASALVHNDALRPVPNSLGVLPAVAVPAVWFPATLGVFTGAGPAGLTHLRADALLLFYNLPAMGGAVQNKRAAIGAHIGVRPR